RRSPTPPLFPYTTLFRSASVEGVDDLPYEIPNLLVESHQMEVKVPVQWWRSVGHSHTAFATECFIDELAMLAHQDPYRFRKDLRSEEHTSELQSLAYLVC